MKRLCQLVAVAATIVVSAASSQPRASYVPPNGFVPDAATAVRIAEAVWSPIYGEDHLASKKPFVATLNGDVWMVRGSLPPGFVGGVPEAEIAKQDGRILRVIHSQ